MKNIDIRRLDNQLRHSSQSINQSKRTTNKDFARILEEIEGKDEKVRFSKHAKARMDIRNINLNVDEIRRLRTGFNKAQEKGVRDALILVGDKAFIASINNRTVITTVNKEQLKDNVFTNIDGAVIV